MSRILCVVVMLLATMYAQEPGCTEAGHDDGTAIDLGGMNDISMTEYPKDKDLVRALKVSFASFHKKGEKPPCEYYGPDGLYHYGKRFYNKKLQKAHKNHVHIRMC